MTPYAPENLDAAQPDLVIIGNVIRRVNPEATAVRERGLPQMSFPAALGSLFLAQQALRRGRRHARQDDDVGAHGARARGRGHRSVVPRRRRDAELRRATSGSATGRTSSSRATSTTPPTSTRAPSSCTTARRRRSSPASSSTTPTSTATWRTTSRRSRSSSRLLPEDGFLAVARGVPQRRADRAEARRARCVVTYAAQRRRGLRAPRTLALRPRGRALRRARAARPHRRVPAADVGASQRRERARRRRRRARARPDADEIRAGLRDVRGREAPAGDPRRGRRRARDRRLRAPPHGGARDDRRDPPALSRPAAVGGLRAALEHQPPQHPPGRVRRTRSTARRSRRSSCPSRTTRCRSTSSSTSARSSTRCARQGIDADASPDVDVIVRQRRLARRGRATCCS